MEKMIRKLWYDWFVNRLLTDDERLDVLSNTLNNHISIWGSKDRLHLGKGTSMVNTLFNTSSGDIYVGDNVFTGHNVSIITGSHDVTKTGTERQAAISTDGDIRIGSGVWIASGAIVLGPCSVGDNAVIAAGAVVLPGTTIAMGEVWGGCPAKKLKNIEFSNDGNLLNAGFWDCERDGEGKRGAWVKEPVSEIYVTQAGIVIVYSPVDNVRVEFRRGDSNKCLFLNQGINLCDVKEIMSQGLRESIERTEDSCLRQYEKIELSCDYFWVPAEKGKSNDMRRLGVFVLEECSI